MFAGVVAAAVSLGAATAAVSDASAAWFPDDKLVTVSESAYGKSGLKSEPVCVADVANKEILESVASGKKPAVAILTLDDDMSVVGADGEVICSLAAAMDDYLKGNSPRFQYRKRRAGGKTYRVVQNGQRNSRRVRYE